jgi:beta-galactosidase
MPKSQLMPKVNRFLHGGDYSPEQWTPSQWREDIKKMEMAGANVLSLGIFAWSALEPQDGVYTMDWLGEVLDLLLENGHHAVLSTPSASQPAWMSKANPDVLRAPLGGIRNRHGMRVNFCVTSAYYRKKVHAMNTELARRFGKHEAVVAWHISNEFFEPCYCEVCQVAFREWLQKRYGTLQELNHRWNTAFWSHTFTDWSEIEAPGGSGENSCEALWVNWKRFSSDQYASFIRNEVAPIREHSPEVPVTTNLMGTHEPLDYWRLAAELDFVSMDAYPLYDCRPEMLDHGIENSFVFDLMRSFKQGQPWVLMESTPSSANWMPFMKLKRPGIHALGSFQAVAHGSDSVMYFQWRQGMGGREKFHGAVIDHTGSTETRVFREVSEVGEKLKKITPALGGRMSAEVAIIYEWENRWAITAACGPTKDHKDYVPTCLAHYRPFWQQGITTDIIQSTADFSGYKLIVAPMLYMLRPGVAERLEAFVREGGTLVGTYWTGIVDEDDRLFETPFPGPLAPVFGITNEETDILYADEAAVVEPLQGNELGIQGRWESHIFCAMIQEKDAEVLARYSSQFYAGSPALTRHSYGKGQAYYIGFRGDHDFHAEFYGKLLGQLSLPRALRSALPTGVTAQVRQNEHGRFLFLLNFTAESHQIDLGDAPAKDMLSSQTVSGKYPLAPHGHAVLHIQ